MPLRGKWNRVYLLSLVCTRLCTLSVLIVHALVDTAGNTAHDSLSQASFLPWHPEHQQYGQRSSNADLAKLPLAESFGRLQQLALVANTVSGDDATSPVIQLPWR